MPLSTPDPLYTHMWRFGHETTPKCVMLFLHGLCIQTASSVSIWDTLPYLWLMSISTCYYFSTGGKFWLVSSSIELHTLTPVARSSIDGRTVGTFGIVRYIVRHGSPLLRWCPLSRVSLYSFTWAHYLYFLVYFSNRMLDCPESSLQHVAA